MKKITALLLTLILALSMTACGGNSESADKDKENTEKEIALIFDGALMDKGFNQTAWESIEKLSNESEISCGNYKIEEDTDESIEKTINLAIDNGGKLLVFAGANFETAVDKAQKEHEDIYFYLLDGVPHDKDNNYELSDNTIGVLFAEDQAGYLAGYAAVMDGYRHLGFLGGKDLPSVKRYGYGFVQGASAAASEKGIQDKIVINYDYTDSFEASDKVKNTAAQWYKDGVEVIFSCGGGIINSVIEAAEQNNGRIIGVDVDQSGLSGKIISSAEKGIEAALTDLIQSYRRGKFLGNNVFNYTADNDGVSLEMKNARFRSFTEKQYKYLIKEIKEKKRPIKKDTEVDSIKDLAADGIKIN